MNPTKTQIVKEFLSRPVFVYLSEEASSRPILLMVFFNGLHDALQAVENWLADAVPDYLADLTVTVIDEDLQDAIITIGDDPENWDIDDEPPCDDAPRAYHRKDATTRPDGTIEVFESTNDNLDHGVPSEYADWTWIAPNLEAFKKRAGQSGYGVSGVKVTVELDGRMI